jgi:hypothetical protein
MSEERYEFYDPESSRRRIEKATNGTTPDIGVGTPPPLRYSSPWPWVRAIIISCMLWACIGWVIWRLRQ